MYDTGSVSDSKLRRQLRAQSTEALAKFRRARSDNRRPASARSLSYHAPRTISLNAGTAAFANASALTTAVSTPINHTRNCSLVTNVAPETTLEAAFEDIDDEDTSDTECDAYYLGEDDEKYNYPSSNDDSDDDYDADPQDDIDVFKRELAEVKVNYSVTNAAMDAFLAVVRKREPRLPKDSRTLVKPKTGIELKCIAGGQYYHFGLEQQVKHDRRHDDSLQADFQLQLQINIDGLPLYRSKANSVWPILGLLKNVNDANVFPIGIYYGYSKPTSVAAYLKEFLDEYTRLNNVGFTVNDVHVTIGMHSIVCDAPARAMVKCIKGHSGYSGCDKCTEAGQHTGRVVFPKLNASKRTDESFRRQHDFEHHHGISPFVRTGIGKRTCYLRPPLY